MEFDEERTISTDLRSDISFMNRQMELRRLYRDFKSAIDTINSVTPTETAVENSSADEEGQSDIEEDADSDIELIIQEIELMQSETEEIIDLISKAKFAKNKRVQSIKKQLNHLQRINDNLKARAEGLLDMQ